MENIILWSKEFENLEVESLTVADEAVTLSLPDNKSITFSTYHRQDCCENVYGDFTIVKYHEKEIVGKDLAKATVKSVDGMGFLLRFDFEWENPVKIFIPCYNYQNGYYSSDLDLLITEGEVKTEISINNLVEDHIN